VCARVFCSAAASFTARAEKEERKDYDTARKTKKNADVKQTGFFKKKVKKKTSRERREETRERSFFSFSSSSSSSRCVNWKLFLVLVVLVEPCERTNYSTENTH